MEFACCHVTADVDEYFKDFSSEIESPNLISETATI